MKYNQELNYQRRQHFFFRVKMFAFVLLIIGAGVAGYLYYAVTSRQNQNTESATTSNETSGYFAPTVKVFRSPYFQFQANNTWLEVPSESNESKFVYRSLRSNLIEHELVIYVNKIPDKLSANRVLPANPKGDSELLPLNVSEHCIKAAGGTSAQDKLITFEKVKFLCDSDSTNYTVLVGLVDNSYVMTFQRPDKTSANYAIYYSNLKATPDESQIKQITETFQTR